MARHFFIVFTLISVCIITPALLVLGYFATNKIETIDKSLSSGITKIQSAHYRDNVSTVASIIRKAIHFQESENRKIAKNRVRNLIYSLDELTRKPGWDANNIQPYIDIIESMQFCNNGYFFATNQDFILVAHPDNEAKNQLIHEITHFNDPNASQILANTIQRGEGAFLSYIAPLNKFNRRKQSKISYFEYYEPLKLLIGTGIYVENNLTKLKENLISRFENGAEAQGADFYIVDHDGTILSAPHKGENVKNLLASYFSEDDDSMQILAEGFINFRENGILKSYYVGHIREWGWYIINGNFITEIESDFQSILSNEKSSLIKILYTAIGFMFLTLMVLICFSFISAYKIKARFNGIIERTKKNLEELNIEHISEENNSHEFNILMGLINDAIRESRLFKVKTTMTHDFIKNIINIYNYPIAAFSSSGEILFKNDLFISKYKSNSCYIRDFFPDLKKHYDNIFHNMPIGSTLICNDIASIIDDNTTDKSNIDLVGVGIYQDIYICLAMIHSHELIDEQNSHFS